MAALAAGEPLVGLLQGTSVWVLAGGAAARLLDRACLGLAEVGGAAVRELQAAGLACSAGAAAAPAPVQASGYKDPTLNPPPPAQRPGPGQSGGAPAGAAGRGAADAPAAVRAPPPGSGARGGRAPAAPAAAAGAGAGAEGGAALGRASEAKPRRSPAGGGQPEAGSVHPIGTAADSKAAAGRVLEQPRAGTDAQTAPGDVNLNLNPMGNSAGLTRWPENQAAADEQWQELGSDPGSEPGSGLGSEAGSDVDPVTPAQAGASAPDAHTAAHALHSLMLGGRKVPGVAAAAGERWRANGVLADSTAPAAPAHADAEAGVPGPCTGSHVGKMRPTTSKREDADAPAPPPAAAAGNAVAAHSAETGSSCLSVLANGAGSGAGQEGSAAEREGNPDLTSWAPSDAPKAARPASAASALQRGGPRAGFGSGLGQDAAPTVVRLSLEEAFFLAHALRALRVLTAEPGAAGGLAELTNEVAPARIQFMSVLWFTVPRADTLPVHAHDRACCQQLLCARHSSGARPRTWLGMLACDRCTG